MIKELYNYINQWYANYYNITSNQVYFQFHITKICSGFCKHCYFRDIRTVSDSTCLNKDIVKTAINKIVFFSQKIRKKPVIDFTGGDPLLHPDILEILEYAKEKKVSVGLKCCSNELDDMMISKLKRINVERIFLSLEGLEMINDYIRGRGDFSRTILTLSKLKENDFYVRVKMTISKFNKNQIEPLMDMFIKNNFIIDVFMWARYWTKENQADVLTKDEYLAILQKQLDYLEFLFQREDFFVDGHNKTIPKLGYDFKEHLWFPFLDSKGYIAKELVEYIKSNSGAVSCTMDKNVYVIDFDGNVSKCRKYIGSVIGNIFSDELDEIVYSNKHKDIIKLTRESECYQCSYHAMCGGCIAMSTTYWKNNRRKDPCCMIEV